MVTSMLLMISRPGCLRLRQLWEEKLMQSDRLNAPVFVC